MVVFLPESNVMGSEDASRENWAHDCSVSGGVTYCGLSVEEVEVTSWLWMVSIFAWKNDRKELYFSDEKEWEVFSMGLRSLLIVENTVLGLLELEWMRLG